MASHNSHFLIALIRGPFIAMQGSLNNEPTPPIGLAYLAGALKEAGFPLKGIDACGEALDKVTPLEGSELAYHGLGMEEILERIDPQTKVIAISVMFSHEWNYYRKLITSIKNSFPEATIIAGGEHCTALTEYSLKDCPALDYCALGEGEETLVQFCESIANKENPENTPGIGYLKNGQYVQSPNRIRIKHIDHIPWPDWDTFPIGRYLDKAIGSGPSFGRSMPMMATRGCPYQCTFCSNPLMWTNKYYLRSVDDVIREIIFYKERYGVTGVQFYDLTAIVQKRWTLEFCKKLIEQNVNVEWSLPSGTRSEALDEEVLPLLCQANCKYLVYAPESGSPETLRLIKKKINLDKMKLSIQTAIRCGIIVRTNMIIGFPHETRKNVWETLKLQIQFALMGVEEAPLYAFQPYPGTELFEYLLKNNQIQINDAYFDSLATLSTGKFSPPDGSYCEHIGKWELHFYRTVIGLLFTYFISYFFYPKRIFRTIKNIFSTDRSSTVFEQRLKDKIRKMKMDRESVECN